MLRAGSRCVIDGLVERADLNGSIGVVHRYNEAQQRYTSDDEDDSPRDPNPDEGWDDDGEVYDAYQDDDEGYYDDYEGEGEAEAACYGGAVIEDID